MAEKLNIYPESIKEVYDAIENVIGDKVLSASEDGDISIYWANGYKISSRFVPEHYHEHPRTKEQILVPDKIKIMCTTSRNFREYVNEKFKEDRTIWQEWTKQKDTEKED